MKILSWNVNGLRSIIEKGFVDIVTKLEVDVICLQEVKATQSGVKLKIDGYDQYWNSAKRNGYSGVLVLSRLPVISVREGFGDNKFDIEGRLLTLEFDEFYLLNVYMPMSKSGLSRNEYRAEWDDKLFEYIKNLPKPIVICGDFNVAHRFIDVYPEHSQNERNPAGFSEFEKDNFDRLISYGLVDVYRLRNPNTVKYTWWSSRLNKRSENRGWRLDYFLVSHKLMSKVSVVDILNNVFGSDHCPILLSLKIEQNFNLKNETVEYSEKWDSIDWNEYESKLLQIQIKLARAVLYDDIITANKLQKTIMSMFEAKALAVRHVSKTNTEAGIDGIRFATSYQKMVAVRRLGDKNFTPSPMKSIKIHDGVRERRINIPTYFDRAKATLIKYALDPIAESTADRKSFAFRKGRSTFVVNSYIKLALSEESDLWFLKADIKAYYEHICHDWIFNNTPFLGGEIKKFLRAGHIMHGELFPTDIGISLGLNLSPTIANMVLDGMQDYIRQNLSKHNDIYESYSYGHLIRFADDFIIFGKDEKEIIEIKSIVVKFLDERGLKLSKEKTIIGNASDGFDFLGWNFKQIDKVAISTPSENSVAKFERNLEEKIMKHNTSTESLILKINKSIIGFANYHKHTDIAETFRHLDVVVNALLIKKVKKMHPKRKFEQLQKMYWYKNHKREHIFSHPDKKHLQVIQFKDIPQVNHFCVKTSFNYFLDYDFNKQLELKRKDDKRVGDYSKLWKNQEGKCYFCGKPILGDQFSRVIKTYDFKKAIIHSRCRDNIFEYIKEDEYVQALDVENLLNNKIDDEVSTIYIGLREYFATENRSVFTLTFERVEEIIGEPIGETDESFWHDFHFDGIAKTWLDNGYIIQRLNLEEKKVVFRKDNHDLAPFKIPKSLTKGKIPKNAQDEISTFLKYVVDKYGLN